MSLGRGCWEAGANCLALQYRRLVPCAGASVIFLARAFARARSRARVRLCSCCSSVRPLLASLALRLRSARRSGRTTWRLPDGFDGSATYMVMGAGFATAEAAASPARRFARLAAARSRARSRRTRSGKYESGPPVCILFWLRRSQFPRPPTTVPPGTAGLACQRSGPRRQLLQQRRRRAAANAPLRLPGVAAAAAAPLPQPPHATTVAAGAIAAAGEARRNSSIPERMDQVDNIREELCTGSHCGMKICHSGCIIPVDCRAESTFDAAGLQKLAPVAVRFWSSAAVSAVHVLEEVHLRAGMSSQGPSSPTCIVYQGRQVVSALAQS